MRLSVFLALAAASLAHADEKWVRIRTGPFEVLSSAGEGPARERALEAEQLRYTFGALTGVKEPITVWPIRIVVTKRANPGGVSMSRDAWISQASNAPLGHDWMYACARILIDDNLNRMPASIESGMAALLSTLQIKGPKLTIGAPPPPAERTRDWARLQMLVTDPELAGRARIFFHNLTQGADFDTAYKNAFEKRDAEMEKRLDTYFAAANFQTAPFSGRALGAADFTVREAAPDEARAASADLQSNEAAYRALPSPYKEEGLGWLAELAGKKDEAKQQYEAATAAGTKNPRAWAGAGTKEGLRKAAELNPNWYLPPLRLAEQDSNLATKIPQLRKAATLARRDSALWARLAMALQDGRKYPEAAKAWTAAELAASDEKERDRLKQERRDIETKRVEYEEAERRRVAEEEAHELQKLKDSAMADIRSAEAKANAAMQKDGAKPAKVEEWWDDSTGPKEKASGKLVTVECLRSGSRWVILTDEGKRLTLKVNDPGKLVVEGGGEKAIGCGAQKPAPRLSVEYAHGELRTVEFR